MLNGIWKLNSVSNRMHINTKKNLNTLKKTIDQIKYKIIKLYQVQDKECYMSVLGNQSRKKTKMSLHGYPQENNNYQRELHIKLT